MLRMKNEFWIEERLTILLTLKIYYTIFVADALWSNRFDCSLLKYSSNWHHSIFRLNQSAIVYGKRRDARASHRIHKIWIWINEINWSYSYWWFIALFKNICILLTCSTLYLEYFNFCCRRYSCRGHHILLFDLFECSFFYVVSLDPFYSFVHRTNWIKIRIGFILSSIRIMLSYSTLPSTIFPRN